MNNSRFKYIVGNINIIACSFFLKFDLNYIIYL